MYTFMYMNMFHVAKASKLLRSSGGGRAFPAAGAVPFPPLLRDVGCIHGGITVWGDEVLSGCHCGPVGGL